MALIADDAGVYNLIRLRESYVDGQRLRTAMREFPEWRATRQALLALSIVLFQQDVLPPYVILEIFDWIGQHHRLPHGRKIAVILKCQKSVRRVLEARN
jgi:hypothetical protein